jgi:hypothetical protein
MTDVSITDNGSYEVIKKCLNCLKIKIIIIIIIIIQKLIVMLWMCLFFLSSLKLYPYYVIITHTLVCT